MARGATLAGIGWQELVILGILAVLWIVPIWLMAREFRPRYGTALNGWVISSIFFGWIAVVVWFMFGRRSAPRNRVG